MIICGNGPAISTLAIKMFMKGALRQIIYSCLCSYGIMSLCWDVDPTNRPTFRMLSEYFANMLPESERLVSTCSCPFRSLISIHI